jgi:ectoine hydroxylase-related dioxygenase (phytanoyl-CoA dioxygenase family)
MSVLSQDQISFYQREGYLALPQITKADEVRWLRGIYDRLFAARAGREEGNQFDLGGNDEEGTEAKLPQILSPARYAPELSDGQFRANAMTIARQLLGPEAIPQGEHAILKPARVGPETPWHQDEAYWGADVEYNALSIWIPLQEATIENGCMWFIPRSHRQEVLPHHCINHDPRIHGLELDEVPPMEQAIGCPIPAGGCTIHHNRTMHYAGPNRSDEPRRAYILGFGTPPKKRSAPRDFYWNRQKITLAQQRARAAATTRAAPTAS